MKKTAKKTAKSRTKANVSDAVLYGAHGLWKVSKIEKTDTGIKYMLTRKGKVEWVTAREIAPIKTKGAINGRVKAVNGDSVKFKNKIMKVTGRQRDNRKSYYKLEDPLGNTYIARSDLFAVV